MQESRRISAAAALLAALLLAGCATTLPPGKSLRVYVAENGIITFRGDPVQLSELPDKLKRAGAVPETHIDIIAQGSVPRPHLDTIAQNCGLGGLPNCVIIEPRTFSVTTGKPGANSVPEKPKGDGRPKVYLPGQKKGD